jgi:hypothetical protein
LSKGDNEKLCNKNWGNAREDLKLRKGNELAQDIINALNAFKVEAIYVCVTSPQRKHNTSPLQR